MIFYPTAIGSEPQDSGIDSYPHWTRTMLGHAAANLVRVASAQPARLQPSSVLLRHGTSASMLGCKAGMLSHDTPLLDCSCPTMLRPPSPPDARGCVQSHWQGGV